MLNQIIRFSIRNKLIIGLFVLGLVVFGIFQLKKLPIDAVPDITNNQVQVITVSPSLGAPDVERLVTFPVEQATSNIPGISEIRSFSRFGLSLVTIVFDESTDVYWARQQVAERLQQVINNIPKGVGVPEMGPVTTGLGEIYQYVLRPEPGYESQYGPMELRTIQDWIVRRRLLGVKGVADVSSFGGELKQYEIAVDANRLKAAGVSVADVFDALAAANQNTGGAYIEKGPELLFIRSEGLIRDKSDIESVCVRENKSGVPLLLRDVAEVRLGKATRYGTMVYNDKSEVAGAVVMMLKGANSSEVIENVKQRVEEIRKSLPKGVKLEAFLDRTKMVNHAIGTVQSNLMEGALIVVFVLVLFLGNFRAGFLVASVIPLSMLFAVIMMNLFGVSGNLMSLGALDFGLIIDGAVIIVEAVLHFLQHSKTFHDTIKLDRNKMDGVVEQTAGRMMNSAVFGQIIILVVYLPVFALSGIEGKMFRPMAQTVTFALAGAFLLSLTYIPMMSAWFLSRNVQHKKNLSDRMMETLERVYQKLLQRFIRRSRLLLAVALIAFVISIVALMQMGGEFIPKLEEGDFAVETRMLTGSNLISSVETSKKAAKILKDNFQEVKQVVAKIGSGEIPTDPMPIEAQDLMVILKDKSEWTNAGSFDEMAEKMGEKLSEIPGVSFGFQYPVQMRFNELMTGARQDVVCKVFGEDLDSLAAIASAIGNLTQKVRGAEDIYVEPINGLPQVIIRHNRSALARYGVSVETVNRIVNTAYAGQTAGQVFEGEKRFDLVVRLKNAGQSNPDEIGNLLIPVAGGDQIPLSQLATVSIAEGPNQIQREDAKRRITVGFNVRGRDVQSIVEELKSSIGTHLKLPPGYYITYGGTFENLQAAKKRLSVAVPISLLLIFLLLYFAFGSIRDGLLIYSAIPLSAIGGILSLLSRGMPFSISAGVGFIALFGVAVLNGIVLISEFRRLRAEGWTDVQRLVVHGSKIRLRPVLMTAAVASLGFLPMALSHGAGAEVQRPLATVVIGGLISATFLTLFVLPILYIMFQQKNPKPGKAAALVLLLLFASGTQAQPLIGMEQAVDSARKNNLNIQGFFWNEKYQKTLQNTAAELPPLQLETEYGQFNSFYKDTRISAAQNFSVPAIYQRQAILLRTRTSLAGMQTALQQKQLDLEVRELFVRIQNLKSKIRILLQADSLFQEMERIAKQKKSAGETDILEQNHAIAAHFEIASQLAMVQTDLKNSILLFQALIHTETSFVPDTISATIPVLPFISDTSFLKQHPAMQLALEQLKLSNQQLLLDKAKLYPDFRIGYNNMSIQGVGNDEKKYSTAYRFQSVQLTVGIPVYARAAKSRIDADKIETQKMQTEIERTKQDLLIRWNTLWNDYETAATQLNWYQNTGVGTAENTLNAAKLQYQKGEINYLQFTTLCNQALQLKTSAADALYRYQFLLFQLHSIQQN